MYPCLGYVNAYIWTVIYIMLIWIGLWSADHLFISDNVISFEESNQNSGSGWGIPIPLNTSQNFS